MALPLSFRGTIDLRVRYCECDPMGVAHHASYIPWLEMGRTELLRAGGQSYARLEAQGILLVVVALEVRYRRPIRYDDLVRVETQWSGGSRVKLLHEYQLSVVERGVATSEHLPLSAAIATTTLGCIDRTGSITTLPDWLVFDRKAPRQA